MRTAISLSAEERPWDELVTYVLEAERLGVDICWVTEGWEATPSPRRAFSPREPRR